MGAIKQALLEEEERLSELELEECEACGARTVHVHDMPFERGVPVWLICDDCASD